MCENKIARIKRHVLLIRISVAANGAGQQFSDWIPTETSSFTSTTAAENHQEVSQLNETLNYHQNKTNNLPNNQSNKETKIRIGTLNLHGINVYN